MRDWTYGAEHELADWPAKTLQTRFPLMGRDTKDITIVNSNGIANDPSLELYSLGGEINTCPTDTIDGQCEQIQQIAHAYMGVSINYRSNLHFHIRVPGLRDNLPRLKRLAQFNWEWLAQMLGAIEPIPQPVRIGAMTDNEWKGAMRRYRRRKRSHHTVLSQKRHEVQQAARTVQEFLEAEVPRSRAGKPQWHLAPRCAVNLRQLRETDTIEFRHFPGTLQPSKLAVVGAWCQTYLACALEEDWGHPSEANPLRAFMRAGHRVANLPTFPFYEHSLEVRYRATVHDGTLTKAVIAENVLAILEGKFEDEFWDQKFPW